MLSQVTLIALIAGAMAFPKIEHRAEGTSASESDYWSKYYEKFQEYLKGNNALNIPESISSPNQIQADPEQSQNPFNYNQYLQGQGNTNYQESIKKCMGDYANFPNFPNFPNGGSSGSDSSSSSSSSGGSGYQNYFNQAEFENRFKKCSAEFPQGGSIPNFPGSNYIPSSSAGSSSS